MPTKLELGDVMKIIATTLIIITTTILLCLKIITGTQGIALYVAVVGYVFGHSNGYMVGYAQNKNLIDNIQTQVAQANTERDQLKTEVQEVKQGAQGEQGSVKLPSGL
jgi:hypothetical protein